MLRFGKVKLSRDNTESWIKSQKIKYFYFKMPSIIIAVSIIGIYLQTAKLNVTIITIIENTSAANIQYLNF